jgi:hypothetical protein
MSNLLAPLQSATVATALIWPLAAGVAVVIWSKFRAAARARRVAALEGELKNLYQAVEAEPVPPDLSMVIDALEEGEALAPDAAKGKVGASTRR